MSRKTNLYFECHITIEPVFDDRLAEVKRIASSGHFRVADLLMKKRANDTEERSKNDTFMTLRSPDYDYVFDNMSYVIALLKDAGFKVWRYKIEDTIVDSKIEDKAGLINA